MTALALLTVACASGSAENVDGDGPAGLKLSGRVDAGPVAINDGAPRLFHGDCAARTGMPAEVCVTTRGVGGTTYVVGLANIDRVPLGERVEVVEARCGTPESCARIDEGAVVLVAVDGDLHRPSGGSLLLHEADEGSRYRGQLVVRVAGGNISGEFDVVDRPPPEASDGGNGEGPPDGLEPFTPDEVEPFDPDAVD